MFSPRLKRTLLYAPLLLLGAEAFLHLLQVFAGRIGYLYELEWMEGAMLHPVVRLLHGLPLYGDPTLDFVPALYMPLYYYASALSALVFGENLFALRIVSVAAALLTHWLIYLIVRRITASLPAALLGMALFAWTYPHTAFWFDVARVDSLWTCLLASGFYAVLLLREQPTRQRMVWLVVAFLAAFMAKQSTLFLLPFLLLAVWCWSGLRIACGVGLAAGLGSILLAALLQWAHGGHFFFYVFEMAGSHGVTLAGFRRFGLDLQFSVSVLLLAALLYPWLDSADWRTRGGWLALLAGFLFLSMLSRAYAGAFFNVLMPLHFCLSVFAALAYYRLAERTVTVGKPLTWVATLLLLVLMAGQMVHGRYDPAAQLPSVNSRQSYEDLLQRIHAVDGPVCVASHGYLAWLTGKDFCAHNTQVTDLMTGTDPALAQQLRQDARERILNGYYTAILLDREKEMTDLGLQFTDIPYTVTKIDYPQGDVVFPVNGHAPALWLQFNGRSIGAATVEEIHDAR